MEKRSNHEGKKTQTDHPPANLNSYPGSIYKLGGTEETTQQSSVDDSYLAVHNFASVSI